MAQTQQGIRITPMINTLSIPRTGKLAILASALVYTGLSFTTKSFASTVSPTAAWSSVTTASTGA